MYKKSTQKIINRIIFIVIIFAILCGIGIYILKYEVQGETNIPFEITKIAIAQSVNGIENEGHQEKWNFNVSENNDIYIYLEKNSRYNKTEIIKDVTINNIKINKTDSIGETKIYKPVEDEKVMFKNTNENETEEIVYTGEIESNIKQQKISNQGGIIAFRYAINDLYSFSNISKPFSLCSNVHGWQLLIDGATLNAFKALNHFSSYVLHICFILCLSCIAEDDLNSASPSSGYPNAIIAWGYSISDSSCPSILSKLTNSSTSSLLSIHFNHVVPRPRQAISSVTSCNAYPIFSR